MYTSLTVGSTACFLVVLFPFRVCSLIQYKLIQYLVFNSSYRYFPICSYIFGIVSSIHNIRQKKVSQSLLCVLHSMSISFSTIYCPKTFTLAWVIYFIVFLNYLINKPPLLSSC
jgi:hypothetical protein